MRIHQKDLAVTDHATALPERKRADLFVRDAHLGSIDGNAGTDTTDCLPVERENGLEQRHAAREIALRAIWRAAQEDRQRRAR